MLTQGTFTVGCNYWASHAGTAMWSDWQPDVVDEDLRQLSEAGLQVLRCFPLWPDFQPITLLRGGAGHPREIRMGEEPLPDTPAGRAGLSEVMLERFATFADMAEQHNLKLVVGLLTGWMSGRLFIPPALEGLNVLADPLALVWETRFVREFVRRFKDHPAVLAWDLGNECNVMGEVRDRATAWAWTAAITNTIRAEDPSRMVISGMHGEIDVWAPESLGELCDLLTTHPYPLWTIHAEQDPVDTIRTILHSTAESLLYAGLGGKPCMIEETGVMGPMMASDETAARFLRAILLSGWAHDLRGLFWWCAYDQTHLAHAPYDWNTVERELGLIRIDRTPKPVLAELGEFRRFIEGLPIENLPPRIREAVCLLPLDVDTWKVAYSTFVLAKQAGFDLDFASGEGPLPDAPLYLVPSIRGINVITRRRWLALLEKVKAGAVLYVSMDDGLLDQFEETFGLRVVTRRRRASETAAFTFNDETYTLPSPFRLDMEAAGAEILAREEDGNPAFTRFAYGEGQIFFLSTPIERALTTLPGAFHNPDAQPVWKIYRRLAEGIANDRAAHVDSPILGFTEHPLEDGRRVIVAINYSPAEQVAPLYVADGWQIEAIWRGNVDGNSLTIPANDGVVFVLKERTQ